MIKRTLLVALAMAALTLPAVAQSVNIPRGTEFEASLNQELNTKSLHNGDTFTMTEHDGWFHKAPPALHNATIDGHVENVQAAHMGHGATMNVIIDDVVLPDGTHAPLAAQFTSSKAFEAQHHYMRDAGLIVGGAVVGHMTAKHFNKSHGGLAGAAAGFALATNLKSDIRVKRGTTIHLKLTQALAG